MLPDGRMIVFKGSGHCTMLERHTQFNRVVEGFLAEPLGQAARPEQRAAERSQASRRPRTRTSREKARER
jgi:hypothetical protein